MKKIIMILGTGKQAEDKAAEIIATFEKTPSVVAFVEDLEKEVPNIPADTELIVLNLEELTPEILDRIKISRWFIKPPSDEEGFYIEPELLIVSDTITADSLPTDQEFRDQFEVHELVEVEEDVVKASEEKIEL